MLSFFLTKDKWRKSTNALLAKDTAVNGQQTLCTVPEPVEGTTLGASTSSATAYPRTVDCCQLTVDLSCHF